VGSRRKAWGRGGGREGGRQGREGGEGECSELVKEECAGGLKEKGLREGGREGGREGNK